MKYFLILLSLFISSFTFAGSYSDFYQQCVLKKRGHFKYNIEKVDQETAPLYTPSSLYNRAAHATIARTIRGTTGLYDESRNLLSGLVGGEFVEGKVIREWVIKTIREEIKRYRLNSFEKASLINCSVMMLVDYRSNTSTKLGSIYQIYEKGEGICTEMTAVAIDLAQSVGLRVRSMISDEDHNWPEYRINGTWFILDPTSNGYTFFESLGI